MAEAKLFGKWTFDDVEVREALPTWVEGLLVPGPCRCGVHIAAAQAMHPQFSGVPRRGRAALQVLPLGRDTGFTRLEIIEFTRSAYTVMAVQSALSRGA